MATTEAGAHSNNTRTGHATSYGNRRAQRWVVYVHRPGMGTTVGLYRGLQRDAGVFFFDETRHVSPSVRARPDQVRQGLSKVGRGSYGAEQIPDL